MANWLPSTKRWRFLIVCCVMCFGMLLYFGGKYNGQNASDLSRLALRRLMEWLPPDLPLVRNLFGAGSQPKLCYFPDADEKRVKEDHEISETAANLLPSIMPYLLIFCVCFGMLLYFGGKYNGQKVRDSSRHVRRYIQRVLPRIPFVGSLFGAESQQKLLFVPCADNEPKVGHAISEAALFRFLLNEENLKRQIDEAEAGIPKMLNVLKDVDKNWEIKEFETHQSSMGSATDSSMAFHVFIVFKTTSETVGVYYWWSLEKNRDYIVLQRSRNKENVKDKLKGEQRNKVKPITEDLKGKGTIKDLFEILWAHQVIEENYNIFYSNCQSLVSFVGQQITEIGYKYKGNFPYSPPPEKGRDEKMCELTIHRACSDWSPLFYLIYMGSTELVDKLVASGIKYDINASCNGRTPLHLAIELRKTEMVKHLLGPSMNADPTKRDASGKSALLLAVDRMKEEIIDLLLAHDKVNVDDVDGNGQTALHLAAGRFNVNVFQKLLERGANPNIFDKWGRSPLHLAVERYDSNEIIDLLLAHGMSACQVIIDHADSNGETALHLAARKSNVVAVQKLLDKGANPNILDEWGQSPLYVAAGERNGNVIMDLLLAHSHVKVDDVDEHGQTALHFAAYKSNVEVVKYLINKGANPNAVDKSGDSPLLVAARQRKVNPIIDLLLEAQKVKGMGDVNDANKQGRTALHYAAAHSNEITAKHLIKKGADVNCRTNVGDTPLHYAALGAKDMQIIDVLLNNIREGDIEQYRNDERLFFFTRHNLHGLGDTIVDRLVEKGIQPPCTETDDCTGESDEATGVNTRRFVDKGADPSIDLTGFNGLDFLIARVKISLGIYDNINGRDQNGETLLLVAIRANYVNAVKRLLENGADPTIRNNRGETPFHVAVMKNCRDFEIRNLLLESGKVDINETTKYRPRETALHMAIERSNTAAAEFLLSKGANPNVTNEFGWTPLHLAVYFTDMDIVELLVNHTDVDVNYLDNNGHSALDCAMDNKYGLDERIVNLLKEKGAVEREKKLPKGNNDSFEDSLEKLVKYTSSNAEDDFFKRRYSTF